jgi:hypothetical protein
MFIETIDKARANYAFVQRTRGHADQWARHGCHCCSRKSFGRPVAGSVSSAELKPSN